MSKVYAKYYHKRVHSWNKAEQKIRITGFSFYWEHMGINSRPNLLRRPQEVSFLISALMAGILDHLPVKGKRARTKRVAEWESQLFIAPQHN